MSLHNQAMKLTPQQSNVIPAGKFIYTDESFQIKAPKFMEGESLPRQGKPLIPAYFSFGHENPDFTYLAGGQPLAMNYNTEIYNKLTGYTFK